MIDLQSIERLEKRISEALHKGARTEQGGQKFDGMRHVFEPTILSNVPSDIALMQEEAFAPVLLFEVAQDFSHALQLANSGKYGLQCGVFTQNLEHMKIAFKMLKFGGIIINNTPNFRLDHMPYGGIRQSGIGREGIRYAMEEMSESKLIVF
jgi:glyceraldehyde-3-phosphate dehydrogenase (NADP+)